MLPGFVLILPETALHPTRIALAAAALAALATTAAQAQQGPIKVGLMLPATGTFAALGDAIEKGFKLYVDEQGGKLAGRSIQYFKVDDESDPAKATDNVNKLIKRDQVDVVVGTVHSGVALAMARAAKESNTVLIVPNAGADAITGPLCAPGIVRSSFSNWQPGYASGVMAAQKGYKRAMTIFWNYAAGQESAKGFTEAFTKGGGQIVKELTLPFPNVEFQALLTEIAAQKPDVVFAFFAGAGAAKFVKDYDAAGLRKVAPLLMPTSMPSSRAQRRAISRAGSGSTWITPSSSAVSRLVGMKPAPMPWIGCGDGAPPEITGEAVGSTAYTLSVGHCALSTRAQPVRWPPVPTPVISTSSPCGKSARISRAVVCTWASMLAGLSNCCAIQAPGMPAAISWARAIAPFMPFSRGVRSKLAP